MKKIVSVFLSLALLCLCACSDTDKNEKDSSSADSVVEPSSEISEESLSSETTEDSVSDSSEESFESSEEKTQDGLLSFGDYFYKLNNTVATIVSYKGDADAIVIPDTLDGYAVNAIGENAFADNTDVKSISTGGSVINIGENAFSNCQKLETINVGISVAVIATSAFDGCQKLSAINVQTGNIHFVSENGVLYNADKTKLLRYPQAMPFTAENKLPEMLVAIGDSAFEDCYAVTAISLPDNCTIGKRAFFHCMNLAELNIGSGITVLPEGCFFGCVQLKQLTVPEGVVTIDKNAFFGCVYIETLSLPESLTKIADNAFDCCIALKNITVKGDCATKWYTKWQESNKQE